MAPKKEWKLPACVIIFVLATLVALLGPPWQTDKSQPFQGLPELRKYVQDGNALLEGVEEWDRNRIKCLVELKREIVNTVGPHLVNKNAILLDQVFHWNIGDSFIQYGTELLLADFGSPVRIPCTQSRDFALCNQSTIAGAIASDPRDPVLLFQGGGNFGDLYAGHRRFINQYVEHFPTVPMLAMPQSVHYENATAIEEDAKVRAAHPDFQLLARDFPSLDAMRKMFPAQSSKLCPDAAQYIGPFDRSQCGHPSVDVLFLVRGDKEKVLEQGDVDAAARQLEETMTATDVKLTYQLTDWFNFSWIINKHGMGWPHDPLRFPEFRTQVGIKMLCEGRMVVTDRLHATIMSTLLGLPHVFLDNSYGKIQSYRAAIYQPHPECSDESLRAHRAETWEEAVGIVRRVFREGLSRK